jgi:hypothetical protein
LKDFANSKAYLAAFNECSEPSIATIIFENFECDTGGGGPAVDEHNLISYNNIKGLIKRNQSLPTITQSLYSTLNHLSRPHNNTNTNYHYCHFHIFVASSSILPSDKLGSEVVYRNL